jgi:hypothetical protein
MSLSFKVLPSQQLYLQNKVAASFRRIVLAGRGVNFDYQGNLAPSTH